MQEFEEVYKSFLNVPINVTNNSKYIFDLADRLIFTMNQTHEKERILIKLLILYPNNYELYYKMGNIFKDMDKERSLMYYKLCYSIKPDYNENFFALCDTLLCLGYFNYFFELNQNNIFDKFMSEPRFLTSYIRCELSRLNYKNGLKCLLDLIKINSSKPAITDYDKNEKWRNYHDAGYLFCSMCEIEKSLSYTW